MQDIKIIAVANHKGGVGKTTTVAATAPLLAHVGYRVLMIDLDPQCSLTESFIDFEPDCSIYDAFISPKTGVTNLVINGSEFKHPVENLSLIPSSSGVSELESMLAGKTSRERILEKILRNLNVGQKYDIILMDCSPDLDFMTVNALVACNELIVPTTPEYMPLAGLKKLEYKCEELAEDFNNSLRISGIIVNRYNSSKKLNVQVDEALRRNYGDIVFKTRIRDNIKIAESPQEHKDIVHYAPNSNGAKDFIELTKEMISRFENSIPDE